MNHHVLEASAVYKKFPNGVTALQNIYLTVDEGETMVLIGESGSGKTTLLRLFNRLHDPTAGDIWVHGRSARDENPILLRRRIGYVQQDGGLLPHWTVGRNVGLVPTLLGWTANQIQQRGETLLNLVNLDPLHYWNRYPSQLSGGERQRVAFARALAADPEVVLLDEPFGALDAITRSDLQRQFLQLKEKLRKTMVLVTHDLNEAFRLGDRVAVLKEGCVLQTGTPGQLLENPAEGYVRSLLDYHAGFKT